MWLAVFCRSVVLDRCSGLTDGAMEQLSCYTRCQTPESDSAVHGAAAAGPDGESGPSDAPQQHETGGLEVSEH